MSDLATLHPLAWVAVRLGLAFCVLPLVLGLGRVVLGREALARLAREQPLAHAATLALGAMLAGSALGWDALDPRLVGARLAMHPLARGATSVLLATLAALPMLAPLRGARSSPPLVGSSRAALLGLGLVALLPAASLSGLRFGTRLDDDPQQTRSLVRAPLRAAIVPTDATARLALAFGYATTDALDRAREELAFARELGVAPARAFEVESELAARTGDCATAERLFRLSLEASLPADPSELTRTPLRLGGFRLPPSLVTRCRYGR